MYSLAEALVLTAAGLVVAIPAVIAFNHFNKKSRMVLSSAAALKDQYVAAILSKK
jgi:biopolymer transport protein ExbB